MAAIDKTYVNKEELFEAIEWAKGVGEVTLENGYKFRPLDWIEDYNDINDILDQNMYCLWNTPTWFDRWLWLNCPLSFIKERIQEVYDAESLNRFETWEYKKKEFIKQKYTFIEVPNKRYWKWIANNMRRDGYYINKQAPYLINIDGFYYDSITDSWCSEFFHMLPIEGFEYLWKEHHKHIPNKKSILRQLRKWYIPSGTVVKVRVFGSNKLTFKILVK